MTVPLYNLKCKGIYTDTQVTVCSVNTLHGLREGHTNLEVETRQWQIQIAHSLD